MNNRTNEYWARRADARMVGYQRDADRVVRTITTAYDKAVIDIMDEINTIFRKFSIDGQMTEAQARRVLNQRIPNPLLSIAKKIYPKLKNDRVKRWLLNKMNAPAYRARISRLQALREQVYIQSKIIADAEITASTAGYVNTINNAYYQSLYDMQKGLGVGFTVAAMPNRTIEAILTNPWSGEQFSSRVWHNTDVLAEQLNETITSGLMSGKSTEKMRKEIEERMNVSKHVANRLVRTEITYMSNAAEIESYKAAEIEKYIFIATLDLRTSEICRELDLKVFDVANAQAGKNLPPMHPYCRSTTIAYFSQRSLDKIQRRARDPKTGKSVLVPAGMNYKQWYEKFVKG